MSATFELALYHRHVTKNYNKSTKLLEQIIKHQDDSAAGRELSEKAQQVIYQNATLLTTH
jgi:TPR repeat protein